METISTQHHDQAGAGAGAVTVVLHVGGLCWATEKTVVESVLRRMRGVEKVEANPVGQTATVTYNPEATSVADLRRVVEGCGYHCAGQSIPGTRVVPCRNR